ncbi:tetratricopeptide repeat protein [Candidatus Poribacteria bacterium]|nr:tetratricopeptide repeat protein [Candidatus Poribacteria bacterium]
MNTKYILRFVLIIFLIVTHLACSTDTESESATTIKHTQIGWSAYNSGDFTQSLLSFKRALKGDPEYADAHNGVGWSNLSLSLSLQFSQESFQNAVKINPMNADAWVGLATVLYLRNKNKSDFDSAIRAIENALEGDEQYLYRHDYSSEANLHALKAACYYYLGKKENTINEIRNTLSIDSENSTALALQSLITE